MLKRNEARLGEGDNEKKGAEYIYYNITGFVVEAKILEAFSHD